MDLNCPFCHEHYLRTGDKIFQKGKFCTLILANSQSVSGTMFIVPHLHKLTPFDLNAEELAETGDLLKKAKLYGDENLLCDGYSIYWNVGESAGQGLEHTHLHIVPRYSHELYAGKGPGYWIKSKMNGRSSTAK